MQLSLLPPLEAVSVLVCSSSAVMVVVATSVWEEFPDELADAVSEELWVRSACLRIKDFRAVRGNSERACMEAGVTVDPIIRTTGSRLLVRLLYITES